MLTIRNQQNSFVCCVWEGLVQEQRVLVLNVVKVNTIKKRRMKKALSFHFIFLT